MKKIALIIFALSFIFSQTPQWFWQNEIPGYSVNFYYTGAGEGSTYADAQANAQAAIAAQLRVNVESTVETLTEALETDERLDYQENFKQATKSTVNETIQGIEVVKYKKVNDRYYVFAVLNKAKYLSGLRVVLDQLWNRINSLVTNARKYANEGRIFAAIENYTDAQVYVIPFYTKKAFYDGLSPAPFFVTENITLSELVSEVRNILTGVNIKVASGDKQAAKAGGVLMEPISFYAYFKNAGKKVKIPIPNFPLTVKYEDGTVIERGSTNADGVLESFVVALPISSKYGKVYARPNLARLPSVYKKHLKKAEGIAQYSTVQDAPIAFTLNIFDEEGKRLNTVEKKMIKSIEKLGYMVSDNAELNLEGKTSIIEENEVEGIQGLQYLVTTELSLFMIVKSTNEIVSSFTSNGKGLSDKSNKKAIKASYNKLKIKKRDLADMLAEAGDELERVFELKAIENLKKGKTFYNQGKLKNAIGTLALVSYGEERVKEAVSLIKTIKDELNRKEAERIKRIQEEKEKLRILEFEKVKLAAETEQAKIAAEVDKAQLKAQEIEAFARVEEAKVAMENIKAEIAQIEKDKLEAEVKLAKSGSEADQAKSNVLGYLLKTNKIENELNTKRINNYEERLIGDWMYLGSIEIMSGYENYSGAGRILSFLNNHTFKENNNSGRWEAKSNELYINTFSVPYVIENENLILSFQIGEETLIYVYQLF